MPADMRQLEDRLRAAYSDTAATVRREDISEHAPAATSPVQWRAAARTRRRRGPALAAAAAVLLIVITATVIPHVLQSGSRSGGPGTAGHMPHSHIAYVVSTSQGNPQGDALVPVNLVTSRTLKPIPLGVKGYGSAVAISPSGKLAYVLTARSQLVPVDLETGRAGPPIDLGGISQDLLITPDGKAAYVLQPWYGVAAVDLATRTALGFIKVHDARSYVLTPDGKTLYVLSYSVSSRTSHTSLTAIDTTTNTTIATIELHARGSLGMLPGSLAMAPDGKTVYTTFELSARGNFRSPASMRSTDEIIPVDVASNTQRKPIVTGPAPGILWYGTGLTISPDSQMGYLHQTRSLIPVDLRTGAVRPPTPLPATYTASIDDSLTFSPDSQRLYMIGGIDPTVIPVDAATGKMMQPIQLGRPGWHAWHGVFAPGGKTLYTLSYEFDDSHGLYVAARMTPIDAATGNVGKPIDIPAGRDAIVFSP